MPVLRSADKDAGAHCELSALLRTRQTQASYSPISLRNLPLNQLLANIEKKYVPYKEVVVSTVTNSFLDIIS